ncbi:hypothetical protein VTO58DRAFT_102906 [Aureobasidium pullulans]
MWKSSLDALHRIERLGCDLSKTRRAFLFAVFQLALQGIEGTFPESRRFLNPECRRHPAALGESRHVRSTLALELLAATTLRVDRRNYLDLTVTTSTILASLMELEKKRP